MMRRKLLLPILSLALAGVGGGVAVASSVNDSARPNKTPPAIAGKTKVHQKPTLLFAVDARSGTLVPVAGKAGTYTLTLRGVHPTALYFEDRPGDEVGAIGVGQLLGLFWGKKASGGVPNAAINALVPQLGNAQYLMGVKLLTASYQPKQALLRFRVRALKEDSPDRAERGRTDVTLPRTFGDAALFIDSIGGHTCTGHLDFRTNSTWSLESDSNWPTDDWASEPSSSIGAYAQYANNFTTSFESDGGSFRGCHASATFSNGTAEVTLSITDPWSGSNQMSCTVGGDSNLGCLGPTDGSTPGGDQMDVWYMVCEMDDSNDSPYPGLAGTCSDYQNAYGGSLG